MPRQGTAAGWIVNKPAHEPVHRQISMLCRKARHCLAAAAVIVSVGTLHYR
jgi:hypothetical protein